jgi:hypothetical protein
MLVKQALTAAIDGEALFLASTLRDLKKLGISPMDDVSQALFFCFSLFFFLSFF